MQRNASFLLLLLCVSTARLVSCLVIDIEAEDKDGVRGGNLKGTPKNRTNASNGRTIRLHESGSIAFNFSTTSVCELVVKDVIYSNNHHPDIVLVFIDENLIGNFTSITIHNVSIEIRWNTIRMTGQIGEPIQVESGVHTLTLLVTEADQYGIEFDKITLEKNCMNVTIQPTAATIRPTVATSNSIVATTVNTQATASQAPTAEVPAECGEDTTVSERFGAYNWSKTIVGSTARQPCHSNPASNATRLCVSREHWATVDFTNCVQGDPQREDFTLYLRFATVPNTGNLSQSIMLANIQNTVLQKRSTLSVQCTAVTSPPLSDGQIRVSCVIVALSNEPLETYQSGVINELRASNISQEGTEIGSEKGYCNFSSLNNDKRGLFQWNETEVNSVTSSTCMYGPPDVRVTQRCVARNDLTAPNITKCRTVISSQISTFERVNVTSANVESVVANITSFVALANETSDQNQNNLAVVTSTLVQTSRLVTIKNVPVQVIQNVTGNVVNVLDNVDKWPEHVTQAHTNQLIQSYDNITVSLIKHDNFSHINIVTKDVALHGQKIERDIFRGITLSVQSKGNQSLAINTSNTAELEMPAENLNSVLILPSDIAKSISNNSYVSLAFTAYDKSTLFPVRNAREENASSTVVASQVISMTIADIKTGTKLSSPVQLMLKLKNTPALEQDENITNRFCAFWDFNSLNGLGGWNTSGCSLTAYNVSSNIVTCQCNHLTNFACLVDISLHVMTNETVPPLPKSYRTTLEIISYIGIAFSIVGLILFLITFIGFKKLRQKDVAKFHIQLALALLVMLLIFVIGINRTESKALCVTVGVLLHYFLLASWMLMGAEALIVFQKLVIVFSSFSKTMKFVITISVICWGVPLIPVIISVSVNVDNYIRLPSNITGAPGFCFISNTGVFFGAFYIPILLVVVFNIVMFIPVLNVLIRHTIDQRKSLTANTTAIKARDTCKLTLSIIGIMFLLGLSWTISLFTAVGVGTNRDAAFALDLIFVLLNSFQGFFLFVIFVVFNSEAREAWCRFICCSKLEKDFRSTGHHYKPHPPYRSSTNSSELSKHSSFTLSPVESKASSEFSTTNHSVSVTNDTTINETALSFNVKKESSHQLIIHTNNH